MSRHSKQFQMYADAVKSELEMTYQQGEVDGINELVELMKPCNSCPSYHNECNDADYFEDCCRVEKSVSWEDLRIKSEQLKKLGGNMARQGLMDDAGIDFEPEGSDKCAWKYTRGRLTGCLCWNIECGRKELGTRVIPNYSYCPSCGKEILFIEDDI